jgi:hypothetical protein
MGVAVHIERPQFPRKTADTFSPLLAFGADATNYWRR